MNTTTTAAPTPPPVLSPGVDTDAIAFGATALITVTIAVLIGLVALHIFRKLTTDAV